jgi:hypothetical protein
MICSSVNLDRFIARLLFHRTGYPQSEGFPGKQVRAGHGWIWLRGQDLNLGPSGYEPDELPGCSTPRGCGGRGGLEDLAATYSPASCGAVPSALGVFTAEFGMGSGVLPPAIATRSSSPPGVVVGWGFWCGGVCWVGLAAAQGGGSRACRAIRTGWLRALPRVHLRPIDVLV